jgi:hypothetical protein
MPRLNGKLRPYEFFAVSRYRNFAIKDDCPWIVRAAATAKSICVSAQKIDRIQSSPEERRRCVMYLANLPSG